MSGNSQDSDRQKVLIAGAGIAGVEAALALRELAGDLVEVELCDPRREFSFKPFAVGEPYGAARVFRYDLRALSERCGASFRPSGIVSVDPERRQAVTREGERLPYDHLILAGGVRMLWSIPGAVTFWGVADEGQVGDAIADLRAGALERVVFTMPGGNSWALPLYELALLAATEIERSPAATTQVTIVTPEDAPLEVFGRQVGEGMSALLAERGIELVTGAHPIKFEDRRLRIAPGREVEADVTIGLPRLEGRRIAGIPHDRDGFVGVDEHCRAIGLDRVYAAGDVTAFPIKQGGIAGQQADVAAEAIAAAAGAGLEASPFDPVLRGVLWTGREPRYLYGRPTGGHGEASSLSERPQAPIGIGKVAARHLWPLIEELSAESEGNGAGPAVATRLRSTS